MSKYRVVVLETDDEVGFGFVERVFDDTLDCIVGAVIIARWLVWCGNEVVQIQRTTDNAPIYACFGQDVPCVDVPEWLSKHWLYDTWMVIDGMPSPRHELWQYNVDDHFMNEAKRLEDMYHED